MQKTIQEQVRKQKVDSMVQSTFQRQTAHQFIYLIAELPAPATRTDCILKSVEFCLEIEIGCRN